MPINQRPESRGGDWQVYTGDVIAWLARRSIKVEDLEDLNAEREKAGLLKQQRLKTEFEVGILNQRYLAAEEVETVDAVMFTAVRDRIRGVVSCAPIAVQAALQDGELGLRRVLEEHLDTALEGIGTETLEVVAAH